MSSPPSPAAASSPSAAPPSSADVDMSKAPSDCPGGPSSSLAGKASACAGCPNQSACLSASEAPPARDPDLDVIARRLSAVRRKILILSGKGGVGKSTVSCQLAFALALDGAREVGLLDIDICGPSVPRIMGCDGESIHSNASGWSPVYVEDNLGVMSVGFLLSSADEAVIWRGPKKNGLIKQFFREVDWGERLDYLLIDTPPGTSDEHLSLVQFLKEPGVDGAIVVTTPQEVAMADVRKEVNFCKKVGIPVLGVVENMSGFVCGKCLHSFEIFPPDSGGAAKLAADFDVPFLGKLPLDPILARACDEGKSYLQSADAQSPGVLALKSIAEKILQRTQ